MRIVAIILLDLSSALHAIAQQSEWAERTRIARELVIAGKAADAVPIYKDLVRAFPNDPEMLMNLAIAEFKAKDYAAAAQHAATTLKLRPDMTAANLFLGASYLELGRHSDAVEPLKSVIAAVPDDRNARLMLAESLLRSGRPRESVEHFQKSVEQIPGSTRAWYGLGRAYSRLADEILAELGRTAASSAFWWALMAESFMEQHRFGSAFEAYRQALAKQPALPGLHAGLARVYRETGHPDWAAQHEQREGKVANGAESAGPGADLYRAYKSYRKLAADAYDRLRQLPPSPESHIQAANTFDRQGGHRQASVEWRAALKLAPDDLQIYLGLAWSLYRSRDYDAIFPVLQELLKKKPDSAEANFLYGASLVNVQQPDKAIPYLRAALSQDPTLRAAEAALGQALLSTGNTTEAIRYLKEAASRDEEGSARFQLYRAYQIAGQQKLAAEALAAYQQFRTASEERRKVEEGAGITGP